MISCKLKQRYIVYALVQYRAALPPGRGVIMEILEDTSLRLAQQQQQEAILTTRHAVHD